MGQNILVFIKKASGHVSLFLFASLFCTSLFLVGVPGADAKTLNRSGIQPERLVQGSKVYNLAQLLKMPGIKVVTAKSTSSLLTPAVTDYISAHASIHFLYSNGQFLCGYGLSTATAVPSTQIVNEQGDLYVNGNWKDGTDSGGFGSATGETGCWNFATNTYWEMYSSAATTFPDGKQGFAETSTTAYEP